MEKNPLPPAARAAQTRRTMTLGFLGSGKMASALARGVVGSGAFAAADVLVTDVVAAAAEKLALATGARVARDNRELAGKSDAIVLCVKPADALAALQEAGKELPGKLVISIVAGLSIAKLEEAAGPGARIARVMPNTPALVHHGAAAYALGASANVGDGDAVERIFGAVGFVARVREDALDAVTGLSGSGPAFIYMVIEAHHTAVARRDGTPLPNPFGLNDLSERLGFGKAWPGGVPPATPYEGVPNPGPASQSAYVPPANPYATPYTYVPPVANWGAPQDMGGYGMPPIPPMPPMPPMPSLTPDPNLPYYRRLPSGAIWLIALGLFFMVANTSVFHVLHGRFLGPILLVGVGVWIFVRKMTSTGQGIENDGTPLYHWRLTQAINSSFWVVLTGFIWLINELHILSWSRSWPLFVIGAGVMAIFRRTAHPGYGYGYPPPVASPPVATPVPSTDLVRSETHSEPGSNDQEGR